jgi:ribonuclease G
MSAEILMNVTPQESRVALLENGVLQEVLIERTHSESIVGNIYKGEVRRVLPGMDAAFIDIGMQKSAFLHASDLKFPKELFNGDPVNESDILHTPPISKLLYEGKQVLVQVIKDPIGSKGARLTTYVTIPSRYVVLMPSAKTIGVSSKIDIGKERSRLKKLVHEINEKSDTKHGYIIRTAAEGVSEELLKRDIEFLKKLWLSIGEIAESAPKGSIIYSDLPLVKRILRDVITEEITSVRVDSRETASKITEFCEKYVTELVGFVSHYPGERPIFDLYGVEDEIQKALKRKVQLKSGGYLIIDQTEAMTTIDVNTGGFVGHRNLEETIFKTNLEAAQAIARQLRLRNLGGIIILDFIDMKDENHKDLVLAALEKALAKDYTKTTITPVSSLGLVEMTRKRTSESLGHILCESCPTCHGRGYIKTATTVCYEIFREILREFRQFDAKEFLILASQDVVDLFLDEESESLAELQEFINLPIRFQVENLYTQEQFDVVLL